MNRIALGALALAGWTVVRRARADIARARAAYDDRVEWELRRMIEDHLTSTPDQGSSS